MDGRILYWALQIIMAFKADYFETKRQEGLAENVIIAEWEAMLERWKLKDPDIDLVEI